MFCTIFFVLNFDISYQDIFCVLSTNSLMKNIYLCQGNKFKKMISYESNTVFYRKFVFSQYEILRILTRKKKLDMHSFQSFWIKLFIQFTRNHFLPLLRKWSYRRPPTYILNYKIWYIAIDALKTVIAKLMLKLLVFCLKCSLN